MFIEQLTIEGFKSYRDNTVIDGFDRQFNAITGPNGTGKSNILDAICFVLGITNLSHLRAQNLQELIYKQGQSGITKASVEIVFNNENKPCSPIGYEQFDHIIVSREVTAGSPSKYHVNGHPVAQSRVQTMFQSVQLNVNNPHFLIMQGRIRKVLDMKPSEILGLIEEAAGIRMFEDKKEDSLRIIEQKERKISEIAHIIKDEVFERLLVLRNELNVYKQWSAVKADIDRLNRWMIAFEYSEINGLLQSGYDKVAELEGQLEDHKSVAAAHSKELKLVKSQVKALRDRKGGQEKAEFTRVDKSINELERDLSRLQTLRKQTSAELDRFRQRKRVADRGIGGSRESLEAKRLEVSTIGDKSAEVGVKVAQLQSDVSDIESRIKAVKDGKVGQNDGTSVSQQIAEQQRCIRDCEVAIQRAENCIPNLRDEKSRLLLSVQKTEATFIALTQSRDRAAGVIQRVNEELRMRNFDSDEYDRNVSDRERISERIAVVVDEIDQSLRRLAGIQFEYTAPPGFNKDNVHGVLARLVRLRDPAYTTAVEVTGGGRLYWVVVESVDAAKALLKHGRLQHFVHMIPLDKIDAAGLTKERLAAAKRVAPSAKLAPSLLIFEEHIAPAVQFAFGQSIVCDTLDEAEAVAFTREVRAKSVTKGGQVFDPQGTLSGGSRDENASIMGRIAAYEELRREEADLRRRLAQIDEYLNAHREIARANRELLDRLDLGQRELAIAEADLAKSSVGEAKQRLSVVEAQITDYEQSIQKAQSDRKAAQAQMKELQDAAKDWEKRKNAEIRELQANLKKAQTLLDAGLAEKENQEIIAARLRLELSEAEKDIGALEREIEGVDAQIAELEKTAQKLEDDRAAAIAKKAELEEQLSALKHAMAETDRELRTAVEQEDALERQINQDSLEHQRLEQHLGKSKDDQANGQKRLKDMKAKHTWIVQEERFFGVPHTDFDFSKHDPDSVRAELERLNGERAEVEGTVNKRAVAMCEKAEAEYDSLVKKQSTVEQERDKIRAVITELDVKKREAIAKTHETVDRELGTIVSQVLPGATAALLPIYGRDSNIDGLELAVELTDVRKSLQELSGGQRSLIALALVLALLKFKPAPFYILDEIDSALDLNHTQNIGRMLRESFKSSQFIIVSLKDGMWNNANVVFQTSFGDSTSSVHRRQHTPS
jgi:structural maintenance of chromosome 2